MHKSYLLLRNNQQTGPYTLEELLQFNLKPFDLVWVDGRSAAWQYPGEIPALQSFVPGTPQADVPFKPIDTSLMEEKYFPKPKEETPARKEVSTAASVFVSMPKNKSEERRTESDERRTESAERRAEGVGEYNADEKELSAYAMPEANFKNRRFSDEENKVTSWNYRPQKQTTGVYSVKFIGLVCLLLLLIGGGIYLISRPASVASISKKTVAAVTSIKDQSNLKNPTDTRANTQGTPPSPVVSNAPAHNEKVKTTVVAGQKNKKPLPVTSEESVTSTTENEKIVVEKKEAPEEETAAAEKTNGKEKKKKLREVLKGIFSSPTNKKSETKNVPVAEEDPKPATNRQAARRGEQETNSQASEEETATDLKDLVDISSNAPDNWMMGISGLKVTLRNRSSSVIHTAAVQVMYYDANNTLLQKKLVYFNNVPAKGKQTAPAPDHKFADHVEFALGAVSAKGNSYVKD